jgi:phenylpropionate dioxygenase-like ring-hydroxylating dioxygenase large terminal subunit
MQTNEYGWWAVLDAREVGAQPLGVKRFGQEMVFWRKDDGAVVAQSDRCPHRGTKLSPGKVKDGCIECPFHGFRFDAAGACTSIPAHPERRIPSSMRVATWPVREAHGFLWLWVDETREPTAELPWFEELGNDWSVGGFESTWSSHFTRCVENQLDYAHLAFVHKKTVGRFVREEADWQVESGPLGREGAGTEFVAFGSSDAEDMGIEWREPNIWVNRLGPKMRITAMFVPVDEDTTKIYLRTWQKFVTVPGLAWAFQKVNALLNRRILNEDESVVQFQTPRIAELGIDERLVPSDEPILRYRKLRARRRRPRRLAVVKWRPADKPAA